MQIVFINTMLSQPRCIKRVKSISNLGYRCIVYGYNRGTYDCNTYPDNIEVNLFSAIFQNGSGYIDKCRTLNTDISRLITKYSKNDTLFYAFDMISALVLRKNKRYYAYEISDIPYGYPKFRGLHQLFKLIDKSLIKKSYLTIFTSQGFYKYFNIKSNNIIIQPNKLDYSFIKTVRNPIIDNKKICFGFVGAIRYESIFRFAETIGLYYPQYEFIFWGGATEKIIERCLNLTAKYKNIRYNGKFKNPDDLHKIYKEIDVVVACYDTFSLNERIAEPNKLYEAIFFCRPIIVSDNTFLAEQVRRYECGYAIDSSSIESINQFIKTITLKDLHYLSNKEYAISAYEALDSIEEIKNQLVKFPKFE